MNLKTDLLKPQQHVRTHKLLLEYKHKKAPSSFRTQGFRKMAATYSPAGVQYHRRGRA